MNFAKGDGFLWFVIAGLALAESCHGSGGVNWNWILTGLEETHGGSW